MATFALEYLRSIAVTIAVTLFFVQLNSDPVTGILALDLSDKLDDTLLPLPLKWDERNPLIHY
jgi:hypothetical protein